MTLDDQATEKEILDRELALEAQKQKAAKYKLWATGECLSCGETDLPTSDALHCGDPDCRDRVETIIKQRERGMR